MKPTRSFLFVPGVRESWIDKSVEAGADALILDLEDSVPLEAKVMARDCVAGKIAPLAAAGQRVWVRINRSPHLFDFADIKAVVREGLEGIVLPKPQGPDDIRLGAAMVAEAESLAGLAFGLIRFHVILETARSLELAHEIAKHDRVAAIAGAPAKNADVARSVGFQWTREGLESLYFRSRVVLAARAEGKLPIGGLWQDVHDLQGLETFAKFNRQLGFAGEVVLHPSNVAAINRIYAPSEEEIAYFTAMVRAYEGAKAAGHAAVVYDGEHIDTAHVKTAREILALAESFKAKAQS
jgi:citrate lyase subunit beta/citryl-CoA lyase